MVADSILYLHRQYFGTNTYINMATFQASWRKVVATAVTLGVPTPAFSTALAFFDDYRSARLFVNLGHSSNSCYIRFTQCCRQFFRLGHP